MSKQGIFTFFKILFLQCLINVLLLHYYNKILMKCFKVLCNLRTLNVSILFF